MPYKVEIFGISLVPSGRIQRVLQASIRRPETLREDRIQTGCHGSLSKRGSEPAVMSDYSGNSIFLALPGAK